jgi:hypothetical protein
MIKQLWQQLWFKMASALLLGMAIGVIFYPTKIATEKETSKLKETYNLKITEMKKQSEEDSYKYLGQLSILEESKKTLEQETAKKVESLTQENRSLKQSSKKQKFKLVKPDGTIIEREMEQSQSEEVLSVITSVREEFNQKVKSIEDRWKKVHEERIVEMNKKFEIDIEKTRSEQKVVEKIVEKVKIVESNKKKLRPELGLSYNENSEVNGYFHMSYPIVGPIFVGGGTSANKSGVSDVRLGFGLEL